LYPGLLKTLKNSNNIPLPIGIFEVSDVATLDPSTDVGAINTRCLCVLLLGLDIQFQEIHGILDRIMLCLMIGHKRNAEKNKNKPYYFIKSSDSPTYLSKRCAEVIGSRDGKTEVSLGHLGILCPDVLSNFKIENGLVAALHLNVQILMSFYTL